MTIPSRPPSPGPEPGHPRLPDVAAPFLLTTAQAAHALGVTRTELLDLVRAGCVRALMLRPSDTNERPPLAFAASLLDLDRREMLNPTSRRIAEVRTVGVALRSYLAQCPPVADYDLAVEQGLPVLARDRHRVPHAHVRLEVLAQRINPVARAGGPDTGLLINAHIADALERLGAVRCEGIKPVQGDRQRWRVWYRLPLSMWPGDGPSSARELLPGDITPQEIASMDRYANDSEGI